MKTIIKFASAAVAAIALSASFITTSVAEVSASAAVSNFYLWRGQDLSGASSGSAAVSGDLSFSADSGVYGGVWASSGDDTAGQEYDIYAGWGGDLGAVSLDVSYWGYVYPGTDGDFGDLADVVVGLGFGDFGATLYECVEGCDDSRYITLDYSFDSFNVLYGFWSGDDVKNADYTHLQLSYSASDNLGFTFSKATDDGAGVDEDLLVNVAYSF